MACEYRNLIYFFGNWNGKERGRVAPLSGSEAGKLARSTGPGSWEGKGCEYADFEFMRGADAAAPAGD